MKIPRCLKCNSVMFHIEQYDRWFCERCGEYDTHQNQSQAGPPPPPPRPPEPGGYPPYPPPVIPPKKSESYTLIIIGAVLGTIIIVAAVVGVLYYYIWSMNTYPDDIEYSIFPKVELRLNNGDPDSLEVKHISGDPLDWSYYQIVIINLSNEARANIPFIDADHLWIGETTIITEDNAEGFGYIDYKKGNAYDIEIYNKEMQSRELLAENLICT
ncbi:MAG: type IV pilin N-terminal domain-containing protein [Thermoplasmata archaeon]|nr:MAG: type IV pilin N-terminal domain-containing protein [Thermoplasmata archaeon]